MNLAALSFAARPAGGWSAESAAEALAVALEQRGAGKIAAVGVASH